MSEYATSPNIIVLMPAYREAERIVASVTAARALPGVTRVLVIDDGSPDDTALLAARAGAEVLRSEVNAGKGAALRAGIDACPGADDDIFLLLDADLGETAAEAAALLPPVLANAADLTIARFPRAPGKAGFGLVKGLARWGTWLLTGNRLEAPISGQRACRRWVLTAAPLADGYGIEVAMNVAAGDAGARILEVPVAMTHNATGRTLRGFQHRGKQYLHIISALFAAAFGNTGGRFCARLRVERLLLWVIALGLTLRAFARIDHPRYATEGLIIFGVLAALCGPLVAAVGSGVLRARKRNFRQRHIPALGGLLVLPVSLYLLAVLNDRFSAFVSFDAAWVTRTTPAWTVLLLLMWMLLGIFDDVAGDADRKGFRGHLTAMLHGKLTTGGVKLLGGGVLALLMAALANMAMERHWLAIPIGGVLIALSANMLNLFDLRPGRALKVFWVILPALLLHLHRADAPVLLIGLALLLATLVYAPFDFAGWMMLGDTGSNPLGAALGFFLVVALPLPGQVVAVILLVLLHLYAERASITRTIERTPWLAWLDGLGR